MIAINNERPANETNWQSSFVAMLPAIQQRLLRAFRHLDADSREDSIEEGVVHSLISYCRLHDQGRADAVTPSTRAWFAALQVKRGRPAAGRMNSKEPLSRYAQLGNGIQIEPTHGKWIDAMVEDKRATVADQVAAKMDVGAWFATLTKRTKQIARDLAFGFSTSEVARKHGVTAGRISQVRRMLEESWAAFLCGAASPETPASGRNHQHHRARRLGDGGRQRLGGGYRRATAGAE
jgi:hypothetical protein